ncbi:beta-ketoacyl-ACP synthase II [Anoxynatronum buryatiense]|uniref:3-oxoacyl-[acyl-carrier-protein] synthase 2 n=1 Tax=Anoxynatronum buryatiense TaxID=489973 RepID=A0AA46AK61_9CLOT|nr:beta-ketoacyl-ACP synthase II [Anoxynatronum buryatiense]SMP66561.1 3-oxoacyl-[acyl-carrier-protein] synthase II [Anoxynatronum buryatiense]
MNNQRVVITGMGCVTPIGTGVDSFWKGLVSGAVGAGPITHFDASEFPVQFAAEVKNFEPDQVLDKREAKKMDRFTQFAAVASLEALKNAGLDQGGIDPDELGVILGCGIGGLATLEEQHQNLLSRGPRRVSPFTIPMMISNLAAGQVAILTHAKGPNMTIVTACASATNAIGEAFKMIQRGAAKAIITGGTEASITPISIAGFSSMKALSTRNDDPAKASRPFDAERDGFVMGEGAGIIVLESLEHAQARGATIYAEMAGYGTHTDAHHITAPDPEGAGAARAMTKALADAGLAPEAIDYINAHGTSTDYNDRLETLAIKKVFGDHAASLLVSSTKSMTGHLLGAAGGVEAIACVMALQHQLVPPTVNYENPDAACDLNYVPNKAVSASVKATLSNSLGFGGHNASILIKAFE